MAATGAGVFPNLTPADPVYAEVTQDKRFRQAISLAIDRKESRRSIFSRLRAHRAGVAAARRRLLEPHMDTAFVEYDVDAAEQWFWKN